jgi:hypothetical protein
LWGCKKSNELPSGIEGLLLPLPFQLPAASARTGSARLATLTDRANKFPFRFTFTTIAVNNVWASPLGRPR